MDKVDKVEEVFEVAEAAVTIMLDLITIAMRARHPGGVGGQCLVTVGARSGKVFCTSARCA
jgi:hypothetical protein